MRDLANLTFMSLIYRICTEFMISLKMTDCLFNARANSASHLTAPSARGGPRFSGDWATCLALLTPGAESSEQCRLKRQQLVIKQTSYCRYSAVSVNTLDIEKFEAALQLSYRFLKEPVTMLTGHKYYPNSIADPNI